MKAKLQNEHISHMLSDKRNKYVIRSMRKSETELLKNFLYEAIFIPEGVEPPAKDIVEKPELRVYTDDFNSRKGDNCLVADFGGKVVGGVYDDRFLVKPVKTAKNMMPEAELELPYEGAKAMLLVDNIENKEFLKELLEGMYSELPDPKKKK